MAPSVGTETGGGVAAWRLVVGLSERAQHGWPQFVGPGGPAQRALFPMVLRHVRPPDRRPAVAFLAHERDEALDFGQRHPVYGLFRCPWRPRAVVVIPPGIGAPLQVWVVEVAIPVFHRQSACAACVDDAQDGVGGAPLADLPCCAS